MARRVGQSRHQYGLFATPLEDMIAEDNPVRAVDAFIDSLDLQQVGFRAVEDNRMGAASYSPADLLKLYFYGYYNRVRSSRMLERECTRNVELMWLIGRQTPSQHTISTFRTRWRETVKSRASYSVGCADNSSRILRTLLPLLARGY